MRKSAVYLLRRRGGLGLISVVDVATAGAIRLWDAVAGGSLPIWRNLAISSFEREFGRGGGTKVWLLLTSNLSRVKSRRWLTVLKAVRSFQPQLNLSKIDLSHLLLLPPSLPQLNLDSASLRSTTTVAALYSRATEQGGPERLVTPSRIAHSSALLDWTVTASRHPQLSRLLPLAAIPPQPLATPRLPPRSAFTFGELAWPFSGAELRRALSTAQDDKEAGRKWPAGTSTKEKEEFWTWFRKGGASARERDTHWRLIYGATPACARLVHPQRAESAFCLHCPTDVEDATTTSLAAPGPHRSGAPSAPSSAVPSAHLLHPPPSTPSPPPSLLASPTTAPLSRLTTNAPFVSSLLSPFRPCMTRAGPRGRGALSPTPTCSHSPSSGTSTCAWRTTRWSRVMLGAFEGGQAADVVLWGGFSSGVAHPLALFSPFLFGLVWRRYRDAIEPHSEAACP